MREVRFTREEQRVLWRCFARHDPKLLASLDVLTSESIVPEELGQRMREAVGLELAGSGEAGADLGEYELELEALLDKLMRAMHP